MVSGIGLVTPIGPASLAWRFLLRPSADHHGAMHDPDRLLQPFALRTPNSSSSLPPLVVASASVSQAEANIARTSRAHEPRFVSMALAAANEAVRDAGLETGQLLTGSKEAPNNSRDHAKLDVNTPPIDQVLFLVLLALRDTDIPRPSHNPTNRWLGKCKKRNGSKTRLALLGVAWVELWPRWKRQPSHCWTREAPQRLLLLGCTKYRLF